MLEEIVAGLQVRMIEIISRIDTSINDHSSKNFVERDDYVDAMLDIRRLAVAIRDDCESATPELV